MIVSGSHFPTRSPVRAAVVLPVLLRHSVPPAPRAAGHPASRESKPRMHIRVETGSAINAFTADAPPSMMIHVESDGSLPNPPGYLRVHRFDLLSEQQVIEDIPLSVSGGTISPVQYKPSMLYGVHRLDFTLTDGRHTSLAD